MGPFDGCWLDEGKLVGESDGSNVVGRFVGWAVVGGSVGCFNGLDDVGLKLGAGDGFLLVGFVVGRFVGFVSDDGSDVVGCAVGLLLVVGSTVFCSEVGIKLG